MFNILKKPGSNIAPNSEMEAVLSALDASQAVIHFDMNGIILDANKNFLDTLGYSLEEI